MKGKKKIIAILCIMVLFMAVGYASFSTNLKINGTASIESNWSVLFTKIEKLNIKGGTEEKTAPTASGTTATFNVDLKSPGDSIEYEITIENQGTIDAIIEDIVASETGSDAITFKVTDIQKGDRLNKKTSTTFKILIQYNENITTQPNITNNHLTISVHYVQDLGQEVIPGNIDIKTPLSAKILKDNIAQSDEGIDFSSISSDTNGKGLYYTNKNTEGGKITYYFRGNVDNNYVSFGSTSRKASCSYQGSPVAYVNVNEGIFDDNPSEERCLSTNVCSANYEGFLYGVGASASECALYGGVLLEEKATYTKAAQEDILWRIVRINEDGSIRLVTENSVATSLYASSGDDNAYVGYMHGGTNANTYEVTHRNVIDSDIKKVVDAWYRTNLSSYSSYLADTGFCNDRSKASKTGEWSSSDTALGYGANMTMYGATMRIISPQFACPQSSDLFTLKNSTKGNKALTYPVGLLTADDVVYAGGKYGGNTNPFYLNNNSAYWTMTPFYGGASTMASLVTENGSLYFFANVDKNNLGVRPVINLKASLELSSGNGSVNNPYKVRMKES